MVKILYGNEPYRIDKEIDKVIKDIAVREMNVSYFTELTAEINELVHTVPFVDRKRIVILMLDSLTDDCKDYMSVPDFVELLIIPERVDKRTKFVKSLPKDIWVDCNKLNEHQLKTFVLRVLNGKGGQITDQAYHTLIERLDYFNSEASSLYTVETALKQLLFLGSVITPENVKRIVPPSNNESVFELSKALLDGDVHKTFALSNAFLERGEQPIALLSLLLRPFQLGYKASLYSSKELSKACSDIGVSEYQLKNFIGYDDDTLNHALDIIQNGITDMKTGRASGSFLQTISRLFLLLHPSA